jgi:hypothetical protein
MFHLLSKCERKVRQSSRSFRSHCDCGVSAVEIGLTKDGVVPLHVVKLVRETEKVTLVIRG